MKALYSILVVLSATMTVTFVISLSIDDDGLVYAQPKENLTDSNKIQEEMTLNLGKPLYTEIFAVPKSHADNDNNLTSSVYSFSGNGTLNEMEISATGNGIIVPREDGTSSVTDGRALFTSKNGSASYSFEAIIDIEDNVTKHLGAAFFDANATGNLEFLNSMVGVYKALIDERGTFAMWKLK